MLTHVDVAQVIRNAKLWCDVESVDEAKRLSKEWNWTLVPGFTASKILWLKEREPENFSKLSKVLLPHDYFNFYLTGRYCMEVHLRTSHSLQKAGCTAYVRHEMHQHMPAGCITRSGLGLLYNLVASS